MVGVTARSAGLGMDGRRLTDLLEVLIDGDFVELVGLALFDGDGILRAVAEACPKPVAEILGHQFRLAVDDLDGAFGTGGHTAAAAVAFIFIDLDDFTHHRKTPLLNG